MFGSYGLGCWCSGLPASAGEVTLMILLLLVLILLFGFGGGWCGSRYAPGYGPHFGLGTVVVVLLIIWLLGGFGYVHGPLFGRW